MAIFDKANRKIKAWATARKSDLQNEITSLGIVHRPNSPSPKSARASIKQSTRMNDGLINRIGYNIPRHMVYVHKGVGRGTPIEMVGQTKRKPKEWFNPVIDRHINSLADTVAEELGSAIINNLMIK